MVKKLSRILMFGAAACAALALSGCMHFENSFDLSVPATRDGSGINADVTLPGANITTPGDGQDTEYAGADSLNGTTAADANNSQNNSGNNSGTPGVTDANGTTTQNGGTASVTAPGGNEATTAAGSTPTSGNMTAAQYAQSLGQTEYDILRSDSMTLDGIFGEGAETNPIQMAIGNDQVYMRSEMDGMEMGIYIADKKTYIYLPAYNKYLKLNAAVAKLMGVDTNEFSDMTKDMGFENLPPLTQATGMSDGTMNGQSCKLFLLNGTDGAKTIRVGLNGKKLVGVEYLDSAGKIMSFMYFNSVVSGFPKMPPDGYEEIGIMEFAKLLMSEMDT